MGVGAATRGSDRGRSTNAGSSVTNDGSRDGRDSPESAGGGGGDMGRGRERERENGGARG
jgi:hypothetical protein